MLSLIRARPSSGQSTGINTGPASLPDRVTITAPRHILEGATLHVNVRTRSPVTMPLFPLVTLEHAPYGFDHRHLDPAYTYVMRRGRGRNRRNCFVRSIPRPPPPEARFVILRGPARPLRDPNDYYRVINPYNRPPSPPPVWESNYLDCRNCSRPRPPLWQGFGGPPSFSSDSTSTSSFPSPRSGPSRRVHWPDGHSDGSLSSDSSSSSSCSSSDSDDGPRGGRWRVPRTPSSSPVRGRPYPQSTCSGCDDSCAPGPGPGYRGGGGSRWREAPCRERPVWDRDLGFGVERAPRR